MALRRFFLFSCLSLSFFLSACGEEKPVVPETQGPKAGPQSRRSPFVMPVAGEDEEESDERPRVLTEAEIDKIPVETMRSKLIEGLKNIGPQIAEEFSNFAAKDEVIPLVQAKLKTIIEEFKHAPATRSTELVKLMQEKLLALEEYADEAMRKAESELIRYKIRPKKEESGDNEDDDYEE